VTRRTALARSVPLLAALGAAAVLGSATAAQAAPPPLPGANGTVKIHRTTTPVADAADDPVVCGFYLDAFQFDTVPFVLWHVDQLPPTGTRSNVLSGFLSLTNGAGHSPTFALPDGVYNLSWTFLGAPGGAKRTPFTVECNKPVKPHPRPHQHHEGGGGVEAGGGGTVKGPDTAELTGGAGLLAAAAAGAGALALRRRRVNGR
jgi:hypothetical protein